LKSEKFWHLILAYTSKLGHNHTHSWKIHTTFCQENLTHKSDTSYYGVLTKRTFITGL